MRAKEGLWEKSCGGVDSEPEGVWKRQPDLRSNYAGRIPNQIMLGEWKAHVEREKGRQQGEHVEWTRSGARGHGGRRREEWRKMVFPSRLGDVVGVG